MIVDDVICECNIKNRKRSKTSFIKYEIINLQTINKLNHHNLLNQCSNYDDINIPLLVTEITSFEYKFWKSIQNLGVKHISKREIKEWMLIMNDNLYYTYKYYININKIPDTIYEPYKRRGIYEQTILSGLKEITKKYKKYKINKNIKLWIYKIFCINL